LERRLSAILAADIVGYSRLMGDDEAGTLERLKLLQTELLHPNINRRNGRIFKLAGARRAHPPRSVRLPRRGQRSPSDPAASRLLNVDNL
jgi:hypothetical protein